jgi:peptidoglycan/xylan/chitin deacetylase (PgdA/CDA1 family)
MKQAALTLAQASGLFAAARRATASQLRILCYHGLWVTPGFEFGDCTFIGVDQFEARMERLKRSGLPVLPLGEALDRLAAGTLPPAAVAITIDDGWVSTYTHMLPVLESHGFPATLYATTWYAGRDLPVVNLAIAYLIEASGREDVDFDTKFYEIEGLPVPERLDALRRFGAELGVDEAWLENRQLHIMSAEEMADSKRRGLDLQLHTHRHIEVEHKVDELGAEVEENRAFLEQVAPGSALEHFCYPCGSHHPTSPEVLAAVGVRSAMLDVEGLNAPGSDPYKLRRLLDGRRVTDIEFDAYLAGVLHYTAKAKSLLRG